MWPWRSWPSRGLRRYIQHGIFDDAQINYGDPDKVFAQLKQLRTQLIRVNLVWGGPNGVAKRRPVNPMNPNDPAYDWSVYDRTVFYAQQHGIKVVFSILGTPPWANGAKGVNVVPKSALDLERFATAAARRYSGSFRTQEEDPAAGAPVARLERAEQPCLLASAVHEGQGQGRDPKRDRLRQDLQRNRQGRPQDDRRRLEGRVRRHRARAGTTTRTRLRPATSPLPFLRAMHRAGAKGFDAYAHHPYYGAPRETPSTPPPPGIHGNAATAITLGNINLLVLEVTASTGTSGSGSPSTGTRRTRPTGSSASPS